MNKENPCVWTLGMGMYVWGLLGRALLGAQYLAEALNLWGEILVQRTLRGFTSKCHLMNPAV